MKNKVLIKTFSIMLVVAIIFTSAPLQGLTGINLPDLFDFSLKTEAQTYSGTCGDNLEWSFNDETDALEITGTGAMYNYSSSSVAPWYSYRNSVKTVKLPDGITSIGNYAFYNCISLTTVTIPSSITSIGNYVFYCCTSLTSINVNSDNTYYSSDECGVLFNKDKKAIICCPAGKSGSYTIPDSVTSIDARAFYCCENLTSVIIPDGVTSIGYRAFYYCRGLTSVTISDSVTSIDNYAFSSCTSLADVYYNGTEEEWNKIAIGSNNTDLTNATVHFLGEEVRTVINSGECGDNLTWTLYEDGELRITGTGEMYSYGSSDKVPWDLYRASIKKVNIGNGVTSLSFFAFGNCTNITTVIIPDSVTSIGNSAFKDCTSLASVTIGNSVTKIDASAFNNCTSLVSVTIPSSVTSIGSWAFDDCTSLTSITVDKDNAYYSSDEYGVLFNKDKTMLVRHPEGKSGSYTVPDSVMSISSFAFSGCTSLTSVTIPDSVAKINNNSFSGCTSLTSVEISDNVTYIGYDVFRSCTSLNSITVDEDNEYYSSDEYGVLFNKDKTTLISCPGGKIGSYTIPDSVTSVKEFAFYNCASLNSVTISDSVMSIEHRAFAECTSLASITIGNSVTTIGREAFNNTAYFNNSANWDDKVLYINNHLIKAKNTLSGSYTIKAETKTIADYAFENCQNLISVTIGDSVTIIGDSAFNTCKRLASVIIFDSVTHIDNSAFNNCTSLTDVYYTGTEEDWNKISIVAGNECLTNATIHFLGDELRPISALGKCGDNLTWTLYEDGELRITGTGAMYDYTSSSTAPWYSYRSFIKTVNLPDGITSIGAYVFYYCSDITSVTIPDSVTRINDYAFYYCISLNPIIIPDSVTNIGEYAFYRCESLVSVIIPDKVTSINKYAFGFCTSMTSVKIPNSVTSIGGSAFDNCESLASVIIPNKVTSISEYAFRRCTSLTSITIPDSVTSIGGYAFSDCDSIEIVTIGKGVANIEVWAFSSCDKLIQINVDSDNEFYSNDSEGILYNKDKTELVQYPIGNPRTAFIIPENVKSIGYAAFSYCENLTSITISGGVTKIGSNAFCNCKNLTSITIPDSVTRIGFSAFEYCTSLISITIPDSVTYIDSDVFSYCTSLTSIKIPDGISVIYRDVFYCCESLASVTIPNSVKRIYASAFFDCTNLTDVYYDGSQSDWNEITMGTGNENLVNATIHFAIDESAFTYTTSSDNKVTITGYTGSATDLVVPSRIGGYPVTKIGADAFLNNSTIVNVIINEGIYSIGEGAFRNCTALETVSIPRTINTIGSQAFYYCTALKSFSVDSSSSCFSSDENGVLYNKNKTTLIQFPNACAVTSFTIPTTVTKIGDYAFCYCVKLTSVTIPHSVTSIGNYAFRGSDEITKISMGTKVKTIGDYAFCDLTVLGDVTLPSTLVSIGEYAFNNCQSLKNVVIPDSVTTMGKYAFCECSGLESVKIGRGIRSIPEYSFSNCTSLKTIHIAENLTSVENNAFYKANAIEVVYFNGTETQWNNVTFGINNTTLTGTMVHHLAGKTLEEHYVLSVTTPAGCETDGVGTYACSCGYSYKEKIPAQGHDYQTSVTEPTCTAVGFTIYICSRCNDSYNSDYKDQLNHTEKIVRKEPTCSSHGKETVSCLVCGVIISERVLPVVDHTYDKKTTNPTCTQNGFTTYSCLTCGDTYTSDYTSPNGHSPITQTKNPTCTEQGEEKEICKVCNITISERVLPVAGHKYEKTITSPTCSQKGYTTYNCSVCGNTYISDYVDVSEHNWNNWVTISNPTCIKEGERSRICSACGTTEKEAIPIKGHSEKVIPSSEPTCTEKGFTQGVGCLYCDTVIVKQDEIPALGHNVIEKRVEATCSAAGKITTECTRCEEVFTSKEIQKLPHNYVSSVIEPSCEEKGYTLFECSLCDENYQTNYVPATGHKEVINTVSATCTATGKITVSCTECEKILSETETSMIDHAGGTPVKENEIAPGCTKDGSYISVVYCSVCTKEVSRRKVVIPASGHTEVESTIPATCLSSGKRNVTCTVCGETVTEEIIPPQGHKPSPPVHENEINATCITDGFYYSVTYCSSCNTEIGREAISVEAKGHTLVEENVNPTCLASGRKTVLCSACGEIVSNDTIPPKGHTVVNEDAKAPTCSENGYTENSYCSECNAVFAKKEVVPAVGHIPSGEGVIIPPDCRNEGYTIYDCSICGENFKKDIVPADGHNFGEWEEIIASTCQKKGTSRRICKICYAEEEKRLPVVAHTEVIKPGLAPTCTEKGYTESSYCKVCKTYLQPPIDIPAGCNYEETTVEATCTTDGYTDTKCILCGKEKERIVIPATGHEFTSVVTPPTETERGYTTYTCSKCEYSYISDFIYVGGGVSVTGTVNLKGISNGEIIIEFVQDGYVMYSVVVDSGNQFSFDKVAPGEYTMRVSKKNYKTRESNIVVENKELTFDITLHLSGDLTGDGRVNAIDVARANAHAKGVSSLSGYDFACVDVNGDGRLNAIDVALINAHSKGVKSLW